MAVSDSPARPDSRRSKAPDQGRRPERVHVVAESGPGGCTRWRVRCDLRFRRTGRAEVPATRAPVAGSAENLPAAARNGQTRPGPLDHQEEPRPCPTPNPPQPRASSSTTCAGIPHCAGSVPAGCTTVCRRFSSRRPPVHPRPVAGRRHPARRAREVLHRGGIVGMGERRRARLRRGVGVGCGVARRTRVVRGQGRRSA